MCFLFRRRRRHEMIRIFAKEILKIGFQELHKFLERETEGITELRKKLDDLEKEKDNLENKN